MSKIYAEYALGNSDLSQFKQINGYLFDQLKAAPIKWNQVMAERGPQYSEIYAEAKLVEDKIRAEAPKYERRYSIISRKYEAFNREYSNILVRGKELADPDYRPSLWEFIAGTSREEAYKRHMARYKVVYNKLYKLRGELRECEPYISENLRDTISEAYQKALRSAKIAFEERLRFWNEERDRKLAPLKPILKQMQGYNYLIRNLCIETEGTTSTVSGLKINPYNTYNNFEIFREIFINKVITISR